MKIEQQLVRDQLAVELIKGLIACEYTAFDVVDHAFTVADLTVKRMADDLQKLIDKDEKQAVEDALVKAELQAYSQHAEAEAMAAAKTRSHNKAVEEAVLEERRKGGGINVIETDDLRELLALFRRMHGPL